MGTKVFQPTWKRVPSFVFLFSILTLVSINYSATTKISWHGSHGLPFAFLEHGKWLRIGESYPYFYLFTLYPFVWLAFGLDVIFAYVVACWIEDIVSKIGLKVRISRNKPYILIDMKNIG